MKNILDIDLNKEPFLNNEGIKKILPHRSPMLLVDNILELSENQVIGYKNVTDNEFYFTGHFPENPIMPGVLQIEAMAQTGGVLVLSKYDDPENRIPLFIKVDKAKFRGKVIPGDILVMHLELCEDIRRDIAHMVGKAYVRGKLVVEAEMYCKIELKK